MNLKARARLKLIERAVLSGLLLILSFPGINLSFVAWVALIPLVSAVQHASAFGAFGLGMLTGLTAYTGLMYWIYPMILFNTGSWLQSALCLALISGYMALYVGAWAAALRLATPSLTADEKYARLDERGADAPLSRDFPGGILKKRFWDYAYTRIADYSLLRFSFFAAVLWVSLEFIRTKAFSGFPWLLLGMSQWQYTSIIQIAEFTGVYGISFILILANVSFARVLKIRKIPAFLFVLSGLAAIAAASYVIKLRNDIFSPPYMSVAVLQANIDQYKKWDDAYQSDILDTYRNLALKASRTNPDLIIWPETAVPGYLPVNRRLYEWASGVAKETKSYNLLGAPYNNGGTGYYNAVMLFGPEGELLGTHLKTHLVPFGEFVPFRKLLEPYFGVLTTLGDFSKGSDNNVFPVKSIICASSICSENFFGSVIRRFALNGAEIVINHTNDAWFFRTWAAEQHFIMNVFRAVESRRTVIVSANTGISGVISPGGMVKYRTKLFERTYFNAKVSHNRYMTFFTRHGNLFAQGCLIASLLMLLVMKRRSRMGKKTDAVWAGKFHI